MNLDMLSEEELIDLIKRIRKLLKNKKEGSINEK